MPTPTVHPNDPSPFAEAFTELQFRRLVPIGHSTFWLEVKNGHLRIAHIGRRVLVTREELARYKRDRLGRSEAAD